MSNVMTKPHQLIASDRIEGTAVRRPNGDKGSAESNAQVQIRDLTQRIVALSE